MAAGPPLPTGGRMFHSVAVSEGDVLWVGGGTDGADIQDSVLRLGAGGRWVQLSVGLSSNRTRLAAATAVRGSKGKTGNAEMAKERKGQAVPEGGDGGGGGGGDIVCFGGGEGNPENVSDDQSIVAAAAAAASRSSTGTVNSGGTAMNNLTRSSSAWSCSGDGFCASSAVDCFNGETGARVGGSDLRLSAACVVPET